LIEWLAPFFSRTTRNARAAFGAAAALLRDRHVFVAAIARDAATKSFPSVDPTPTHGASFLH
jgi:hypothetical protein